MNFYLIIGIITASIAISFVFHLYITHLERNSFKPYRNYKGISKFDVFIKDLKSFAVFLLCIGIALAVPFVFNILKDFV